MDTREQPNMSRQEAMVRALHEHWIENPIDLITPYIHPDAEMRLLVSYGELVRGRDEVARAMQEGLAAAPWRAEVDRIEWLDAETALTSGYARYPLQGGGFGEGKVFWLDRLRDGMVWRVRVFRSEAEARQTYADAPGDYLLEDAP
jgi:hypothetical protein